MAFYEELSTYYDYIFPVNDTQLGFFRNQFQTHEINSVVDIACGSGNYTIEFAKWGLQVVGVDLEEDMVEKASKKASELDNVSFKTADMRNLPFEESQFDGAICIGNSLPHLLNDSDLNQAVKEMHRVLGSKGSLILQTVNYDRILKKRVTELPLIENKEIGLVFKRLYNFRDDGLIDFNTELTVTKETGKETFNNTVVLKPLARKELEGLLKGAGFSEVVFYGAFDGREFNEEAPATVVVAKK